MNNRKQREHMRSKNRASNRYSPKGSRRSSKKVERIKVDEGLSIFNILILWPRQLKELIEDFETKDYIIPTKFNLRLNGSKLNSYIKRMSVKDSIHLFTVSKIIWPILFLIFSKVMEGWQMKILFDFFSMWIKKSPHSGKSFLMKFLYSKASGGLHPPDHDQNSGLGSTGVPNYQTFGQSSTNSLFDSLGQHAAPAQEKGDIDRQILMRMVMMSLCILVVIELCRGIIHFYAYLKLELFGLSLKASISQLIDSKILKKNFEDDKKFSKSKYTNLTSSDTCLVSGYPRYLGLFWEIFLQLFMVLTIGLYIFPAISFSIAYFSFISVILLLNRSFKSIRRTANLKYKEFKKRRKGIVMSLVNNVFTIQTRNYQGYYRRKTSDARYCEVEELSRVKLTDRIFEFVIWVLLFSSLILLMLFYLREKGELIGISFVIFVRICFTTYGLYLKLLRERRAEAIRRQSLDKINTFLMSKETESWPGCYDQRGHSFDYEEQSFQDYQKKIQAEKDADRIDDSHSLTPKQIRMKKLSQSDKKKKKKSRKATGFVFSEDKKEFDGHDEHGNEKPKRRRRVTGWVNDLMADEYLQDEDEVVKMGQEDPHAQIEAPDSIQITAASIGFDSTNLLNSGNGSIAFENRASLNSKYSGSTLKTGKGTGGKKSIYELRIDYVDETDTFGAQDSGGSDLVSPLINQKVVPEVEDFVDRQKMDYNFDRRSNSGLKMDFKNRNLFELPEKNELVVEELDLPEDSEEHYFRSKRYSTQIDEKQIKITKDLRQSNSEGKKTEQNQQDHSTATEGFSPTRTDQTQSGSNSANKIPKEKTMFNLHQPQKETPKKQRLVIESPTLPPKPRKDEGKEKLEKINKKYLEEFGDQEDDGPEAVIELASCYFYWESKMEEYQKNFQNFYRKEEQNYSLLKQKEFIRSLKSSMNNGSMTKNHLTASLLSDTQNFNPSALSKGFGGSEELDLDIKHSRNAEDLGINLQKYQLKNINLLIKKNEFCFLFGAAGCGKSSLLKALVKHMSLETLNAPDISIRGRVYYMGTRPWLLNGTLRTNILLGADYDFKRFQQALEFSRLKQRIQRSPRDLMMFCGPSASNVDPLFRLKVECARVIYSRADIVLIDDSFEGFFGNETSDLFYKFVISGLKSQGKTILYASNNCRFINLCDTFAYMEEGEIINCGKKMELADYKEFKNINLEFLSVVSPQSPNQENGEIIIPENGNMPSSKQAVYNNNLSSPPKFTPMETSSRNVIVSPPSNQMKRSFYWCDDANEQQDPCYPAPTNSNFLMPPSNNSNIYQQGSQNLQGSNLSNLRNSTSFINTTLKNTNEQKNSLLSEMRTQVSFAYPAGLGLPTRTKVQNLKFLFYKEKRVGVFALLCYLIPNTVFFIATQKTVEWAIKNSTVQPQYIPLIEIVGVILACVVMYPFGDYFTKQAFCADLSLRLHDEIFSSILNVDSYKMITELMKIVYNSKIHADMATLDLALPHGIKQFFYCLSYTVSYLIYIGIFQDNISSLFFLMAMVGSTILFFVYAQERAELVKLESSLKIDQNRWQNDAINGILRITGLGIEKFFQKNFKKILERKMLVQMYLTGRCFWLKTRIFTIVILFSVIPSLVLLYLKMDPEIFSDFYLLTLTFMFLIPYQVVLMFEGLDRMKTILCEVEDCLNYTQFPSMKPNYKRASILSEKQHFFETNQLYYSSYRRLDSLNFGKEPVLDLLKEDDVLQNGSISLQNLAVHGIYNSLVIEGLDLEVKAGEKVALVVDANSKILALFNVLLKFHTDYSGSVRIGGRSLASLKKRKLRQQVFFADLELQMIPGTLAENIDAIQFLGGIKRRQYSIMYEFLMKSDFGIENFKTYGFNSIVYPKQLTVRDRVLITFAAMMMQKKKLVILDRIDLSFDEGLLKIFENILTGGSKKWGGDDLGEGSSVLMLCENFETAKLFDRIVVIQGGEVKEQGKYDELVKKEGGLLKGWVEEQ